MVAVKERASVEERAKVMGKALHHLAEANAEDAATAVKQARKEIDARFGDLVVILNHCDDLELRDALLTIADFLSANEGVKVRKQERERYDELLTDKLAEFQDEYTGRVVKLEKELADLRVSFEDAEEALDKAWGDEQPI